MEIAGDLPDGKENVAKHDMAGTQHPIQISLAKADSMRWGSIILLQERK